VRKLESVPDKKKKTKKAMDMISKSRIKKYILCYVSLLLFFVLCLKVLGGGYRNLTGSSDPLSWQEVSIILPKYAIGTAFIMTFLIYLDYLDYKKKK